MKKRFLATFTAALLVASMLPMSAFASQSKATAFKDVKASDWSYNGISYACENGIIDGTSDGLFAPKASLSNGTLMTMLCRMDGNTSATEAEAIAWNNKNGISDKSISSDTEISREQFVTALYQYSQYKSIDVSKTTGISYFSDASSVSESAQAAMKWALAEGIITGTGATVLSPKGIVTREQASVMLMNFTNALTQKADVDVQIMATSDLHGWFVPWDFATDTSSTKGSLTYLASVIKDHQSKNANTILVDCGDAVQANYVEYFIDKDTNPMIDAMNYLGYDVWTFGNHEYNFSFDQRKQLIDQFKGAALSGNVYLKDTDTQYLPATTVVERNGVKIGFIGMTTPLIVEFEKGKASLNEVDVKNPMDVIDSAIANLKKQNVDCIVGVIHEGLSEENSIYGSATTDIAKAFPQIDVIISGHAHASITSETVNGVLLCEPYYYGRNLSVVDLGFKKTDSGYSLINKQATMEGCGSTEDAGLVALMAPYKSELSAYVNTPIGKLINADLSGKDEIKGISSVYTGSTGIMNLMSTAGIYYSGADCTVLCTDYENAGFGVGDISIKNVASSYSFTGGEISVYNATGKQLKTLLEWSADYFNQVKAGDLTVSYNPSRRASKYSSDFMGGGFTYVVDLTQPTGSRIKDLALIVKDSDGNPVYNSDGTLKTTPITDSTIVKLGTNSYYMNQWTTKGGCLEGHNLVSIYSSSDVYGDDGTVRALTISYIKDHLKGIVDGKLYNYKNWSINTGIDINSAEYQKAVELINAGTITLPASETGRTNVASITVNDIQSYLK